MPIEVDGLLDAGADVVACRAVIDGFAGACAGETARMCGWAFWRGFCEVGRAVALEEAASCFAGQRTCRSFGDPGTTENIACTRAARAAHETPASRASETAYCAHCGTSSLCSGDGAFGVPFEFLSDVDNGTLTTCLMGVASCDAVSFCVGAAFPDIFACF